MQTLQKYSISNWLIHFFSPITKYKKKSARTYVRYAGVQKVHPRLHEYSRMYFSYGWFKCLAAYLLTATVCRIAILIFHLWENMKMCTTYCVSSKVLVTIDLSIGSTETKYIKLNTKTQICFDNIRVLCQIKKENFFSPSVFLSPL